MKIAKTAELILCFILNVNEWLLLDCTIKVICIKTNCHES